MSTMALLLLLLFSSLGPGGIAAAAVRAEGNSLDVQSERVERLLIRQAAALTQLEGEVLRQQAQLAQHAGLIRQQEAKLGDQRIELQLHKRLLETQDVKLSRQDTLLSRYAQFFQLLNVGDSLASDPQQNNHLPRDIPHQEPLNENSLPRTEQLGSPTANDVEFARIAAEARHFVPRSDDAGPLETVVNRISQKVTDMEAELQAVKAQATLTQDAGSSTFVHWGSSTCGGGGLNASQVVYSGVVGGSPYGESGAAGNYLCLTLSPVFGDNKLAAGVGANLAGGEYETSDTHQDKDPLCAVCRPPYATTVMIPGTNQCTPGWKLQYSGFLMAGGYTQNSSEFICVDSALEIRMGSDQNQDGRLLYYTKAVCGSLPCSPYVADRVVTCAVCSK